MKWGVMCDDCKYQEINNENEPCINCEYNPCLADYFEPKEKVVRSE
jgi:hypothetical protein